VEYNLNILDEAVAVKVVAATGRELRLSVDGRELEIGYQRISANHFHLVLGGKDGRGDVDVFVAHGPRGKEVTIRGVPYLIREADADGQGAARKTGGMRGPRIVTPPMPSVVVKILVEEGERVDKGRGVVVVSAMKMETTLAAPHEGIVRRINVAVGDKASPGEILVEIENDAGQAGNP